MSASAEEEEINDLEEIMFLFFFLIRHEKIIQERTDHFMKQSDEQFF